jgi:hypothetical protein
MAEGCTTRPQTINIENLTRLLPIFPNLIAGNPCLRTQPSRLLRLHVEEVHTNSSLKLAANQSLDVCCHWPRATHRKGKQQGDKDEEKLQRTCLVLDRQPARVPICHVQQDARLCRATPEILTLLLCP